MRVTCINRVMVRMRVGDASDLDSMYALAHLCYGVRVEPAEWWRWWYLGRADQQSAFILAEDGQRLVGMQPVTLDRFLCQGHVLLGAVLTGAMVHPDFRGQGIFRQLVERSCQYAWDAGASFITTMPNEKSFRRFMAMGWRDPGSRSFLIVGPGLAKKKMQEGTSCTIERVGAFDEDIVAFAASQVQKQVFSAQRDEAWLTWRFCGNPMRDYVLLVARDRNCGCVGYAAATVRSSMGISIGWLVDIMAGSEKVLVALATTMVDLFQRQRIRFVATVISGPNIFSALSRSGFRQVPTWISPRRFRTVYLTRPDSSQKEHPPADIGLWYQTLADWDGI